MREREGERENEREREGERERKRENIGHICVKDTEYNILLTQSGACFFLSNHPI